MLAAARLPHPDQARGFAKVGINVAQGPTTEQIKKLSGILEVDAVITGVVREYGTVRSGSTSANVVSLSLRMIEVESGRIVWSASATRGGINFWGRLVGGSGRPINYVTEKVVSELLNKLFQ